MMASKLSQPPLIPPQCLSINSCNGIDIVSSTVVGVLTCPEILNNLVPVFRSRPKLENQPGPRRQMVGATATDSTLFTVVGQPKRPTAAGNGLHSWFSLLTLDTLDQSGFLTADVGSTASLHENIEIVAASASVFTQ